VKFDQLHSPLQIN